MSSTRLAILSPAARGPMHLPASMGQLVAQVESHQEIWDCWLQSWELPVTVGEIAPFLDELDDFFGGYLVVGDELQTSTSRTRVDLGDADPKGVQT